MKLRFFGASIQLRVVYALIASLLWWAMVEIGLFMETGAVYGALVLIPYLPSLKGTFKLKALALLLCGVLSYWAAKRALNYLDMNHVHFVPKILLSDQWHTLVTMYLVGIAGVVGAVIIGIGVRLFVPLALRWDGWLKLIGAGFLGGLVLGMSFDAGISTGAGTNVTLNPKYWLPGHIAWQVFVCLALYYGSDQGSGLQRNSSTLDVSPKLSANESTNSR